MGTTATVGRTRTLQRRRIIQRPRLLALLDDSAARVRALVAAAGYGKTTLAEQWVAGEGRRSAWFTARRSSVDVAALALGLARAASTIVTDCEVRLREHLRAVSAPAGSASVLAEILSEDLEKWPDDAWLVLDDYQELAGAEHAESFVADLVSGCPLQLLLTSRQRPSWVTARSMLYGEVLEVGQTALAMDHHEAAEVLASWSGTAASGLVALANGWPAVIGLASVSSAEIEGDDAVPESLYSFFAEEVFDALGDEVREGLELLAVAPVIDVELAEQLLGVDRAETVCAAALDVGILVARESRLELHPLARSFLEEWGGAQPSREAISRCLDHYKNQHDWDAAFEVVSRRGATDELESLLCDALDDLLETARLSTVEAWCEFGANAGIDAPILSLARAETALRQGRHAQAQSFAEGASGDTRFRFRALSVAGRAAHLASREEQALDLYRRAEKAARNETERRDSLWSQVICAVELDLPTVEESLAQLSTGVRASEPREFVRAAGCKLIAAIRSGTVDLEDCDVAYELLSAVPDSVVVTGFQSVYSNGLALAARYGDALKVGTELVSTARRYRLDFATPYGLVASAMAHSGLREWSAAEGCLDEASRIAESSHNLFAAQYALAARLRLLSQQGRSQDALAIPLPRLASSIPAIRAEILSSRALALAGAERLEDALTLAGDVGNLSRTVEAAVLCPAVVAVVALKRGESKAVDLVAALSEKAFASGAVDLLVTAYRTIPELLHVMLRAAREPERVDALVRRVGDHDLAEAIGIPFGQSQDRRRLLSPRELEVYALLARGLSNAQIAKLLFISTPTAKLHVQHVYNKLGVHSRRALAVQAALERSDQATSAIADGVDTDSGS